MRRLLWVDDDGETRFHWEKRLVEKLGWSLDWSVSVLDAARRLESTTYNAMVLDQMVPYETTALPQRSFDRDPLFTWGGCLLFRWLRGAEPPRGAPLDAIPPASDLRTIAAPLPANRTLPVLIISAFNYEDSLSELRGASSADQHMTIVMKPLSEKRIREFLK